MDKVITVGRQFGSGGHEAGKRLAEKLGIPFYDKELLTITADKTHFSESFLNKIDERRPGFLNLGSAAAVTSESFVNYYYTVSPNDQAFVEIGKVMKEIAAKGPCVIIGRCADYILREFKPLSFFLSADTEDRVSRKLALEEHSGLSADEMRKIVVATDRNRSKFYEYYSHSKWGDAANYHMCINTSSVGVDGAVELMYLFVKEYGKENLLPRD